LLSIVDFLTLEKRTPAVCVGRMRTLVAARASGRKQSCDGGEGQQQGSTAHPSGHDRELRASWTFSIAEPLRTITS
jgi:hypothetical protein